MRRPIAATLLLLATTAPALAAPSALNQCDGYARRVGDAESVGRGLLVLGTLGLFGSAEQDRPDAVKYGQEGVDACTAALADKALTGNPIRHAEALMGRAVHHLELGKSELAVADAEEAMKTPLPPTIQPYFDRSLKPSLLLVKTLAMLQQKKDAEAQALALEAVNLRPWGTWTMRLAAEMLDLTTGITPPEAAMLDRLARIYPLGTRVRADRLSGEGDHAGAARDFAAVIAAQPDDANQSNMAVLHARFAAELALAGDAGAEKQLETAQGKVDALAPTAQGTDTKATEAAQAVSRSDEMLALARAQLAMKAGRGEEARALLAGRTRWLAPAGIVAPVLKAANAAYGPAWRAPVDPDKLLADANAARRAKLTGAQEVKSYIRTLPRFEGPDSASDLAGYLGRGEWPKYSPVRDGKAVALDFSRKTVAINTGEEFMLLAAARKAKAEGQDRFAVLSGGSLPQLGKDGPMALFIRFQIALPGAHDALYKPQAGRALTVAEVESGLGAEFVPPPAAK